MLLDCYCIINSVVFVVRLDAPSSLMLEVVRSHQRSSGFVLVDWLRPAPLSGEKLTCVCEVGDVPRPSWYSLIIGAHFMSNVGS